MIDNKSIFPPDGDRFWLRLPLLHSKPTVERSLKQRFA
jgi:hypothetical protein